MECKISRICCEDSASRARNLEAGMSVGYYSRAPGGPSPGLHFEPYVAVRRAQHLRNRERTMYVKAARY